MISRKHLVKWILSSCTMAIMYEHAQMKCLGYGSRIRGKEFTDDELFEWQLTGCMCTYAGIYKMTGSTDRYFQHMEDTGDNPYGDGGTDIPGARVDFKGTLLKDGRDPLKQHLAVRPREFHDNTLYVLALVRSYDEWEADGWLVGMMESWEIEAMNSPVPSLFGDARVVPAVQLHPIPKMRWR